MRSHIIIFVSLFFLSWNVYAESEWMGRWQTDPIIEGTEKVIMEYDFKSDSIMSMSFFTDNQIAGVGRCVSEVSMNGRYKKIGPIFIVSLSQGTLKVKLLKFVAYGRNSSAYEGKIVKQIENTVKPLFAGFENVSMIYVTHDNPDVISFIIGDTSNAMDMKFHRPTETINQLFGLDAESPKEEIGSTNATDVPMQSQKREEEPLSPIAKMWKSLGFFMLYLFLALAAIIGLKVLFAKNLSRAQSAEKSVRTRFGYYVTRFVSRIILVCVGVVLWGILLVDAMKVNQYITITVLLGGGGLLLHLLSSLSLPVNFMTMKKFKSKERNFVLYLRGFITDNYSPSMEKTAEGVSNAAPWKTRVDTEEKEPSPNQQSLSEKSLAKVWKRYYQPFSVGRPEELESPEGATRIYLDNDSWQNDAMTLMELAKYILVCIHPNDNCIWEIKQCDTLFPEKTIYYVDDISTLGIVWGKMADEFPKCLRSTEIKQNHMMVYLKDGPCCQAVRKYRRGLGKSRVRIF